jgi:hypothetical protein
MYHTEANGLGPTQFDLALHRQQDVVRLNVSVDDTLGVQVLQTQKCLATH